MTRRDVICLILCLPVIEACGAFLDPSHDSIAGTWQGRTPSAGSVEETGRFFPVWIMRVTEGADGTITGETLLLTSSPPPPEIQPPREPWLVGGSRQGSRVRLTFTVGGTVRYFEGKQEHGNTIEGFLFLQQGAEHRAALKFVRASSRDYDRLFPDRSPG